MSKTLKIDSTSVIRLDDGGVCLPHKQQLAERTYELDKRLDAVLERLLMAVTK